MCGIIAIVRRPGTRTAPSPDAITRPLHDALRVLASPEPLAEAATRAADLVQVTDGILLRPEGVWALLCDRRLTAEVEGLHAALSEAVASIEARLDADLDGSESLVEQERRTASVRALADQVWSVGADRVPTARGVTDLASGEVGWAATEAYLSIHQALTAIDRLEVRGRDSAGLHVLVRGHGLDLGSPAIRALLAERAADRLFRSGAVRAVDGCLSFVYKAAAEVGELGDNTRRLREAVRTDELLRVALQSDTAQAVVLGHTRWASVGMISQPNAHPFDSAETGGADGQGECPYVVAALNGDIDNFADVKSTEGLRIAPEITADAKVIPTLVSRRLDAGADFAEAFRDSVAGFEGSMAIAASTSSEPERLLLAVRGSGQGLYVGVADDAYVVASEPYGVVELADRYLRLDGETSINPDNPTASRGQIVSLDGRRAGTIDGIVRLSYDGTPLPVAEPDLVEAETTTRDIDRGSFPHFLLKEITEAPDSFRKTLRGKLVERDGRLHVSLPSEALPERVRTALRDGRVRRVQVIGQGTAAVAGEAMAFALRRACIGTAVAVEALPATELSGFGLRPRMDDTLVVAISQSGTTTDTNRTVDLVRARGGHVVAIVNRRASDLTDKADGVLYTSDGRDVEMSVASTKAFYSQVAAGLLLAQAIAADVGGEVDHELLARMRELPSAMVEVLERRPAIAEAAQDLVPSKRYWAVVGNGVNCIAAAEVRIKLSELCYKSIAFDRTEDKKHIDLSAEPLIVVCAAGLEGSTAADVAKEVAIYRAHKASPVVIATDGQERFAAALAVLTVPETHPQLAFVLSAMAGHIFGYEAALAIDVLAQPLREARAAVEALVGEQRPSDDDALLPRLRPALEPAARRFFDGLRMGSYDGHLEASTAVRLGTLLRYALGVVPLDAYQLDEGKVGTPLVVIDDLAMVLTRAIDELTRPIDAIKHQAKTVTVGISRGDESLLEMPLVAETLAAGAPRDRLTYRVLRTLADISSAVTEVQGHSRYHIGSPLVAGGPATITLVERAGIARDMPSRSEHTSELRGTKHRVADERQVLVARGRRDGRRLVIVPEVKDGQTTGITLLHVRFADRLPEATVRGVLRGYRDRYAVLRDAVLETEPTFREDLFAAIDVESLLTEPINQLADRWRVPT